ncbi:hypothetical protein MLD38_031538 [Melastoma candidum]|uniref:Uncharacterized protein n=1 Tax=Melastoma candidum TaxID=119954 RepID=A0ACB9MPK6_9MYRT|nr:hypothetical protein MLD38_031538 [Melastoma candidum]
MKSSTGPKAGEPAPAPKMRKMERPPTPQELVSYYESRGLDNAQASLKVIEDLQSLLLRSISSSRAKDKLPAAGDTLRKIDSAADRLAILEMKLDSKPGHAQAFAIAVAAGVTLRAVPHLLRTVGEAWSTVAGGITQNKH